MIDFAMRGTRSDADDFDEERQLAALALLLCPASYLGMHLPMSPGPSSPPHCRPVSLSNVRLPHACKLNQSLLVLWSDSCTSPHWCPYVCWFLEDNFLNPFHTGGFMCYLCLDVVWEVDQLVIVDGDKHQHHHWCSFVIEDNFYILIKLLLYVYFARDEALC